MINGGMVEAQQGFAVLDNVDEDTIQRFIEWAYKGYYTAGRFREVQQQTFQQASIKKEKKGKKGKKALNDVSIDLGVSAEEFMQEPASFSPPEPTAVNISAEPDTWASFGRPKELTRKQLWEYSSISEPIEKDEDQATKAKQELKESFLKYDYKIRHDNITLPPTRGNLGPLEDYTDVFLSHARLYVFADMYDIPILRMLAWEELHRTLASYTLYHSRVGDIVALLRYVYANTSGGEEGISSGGGQELRKLLTDYMGFEMKILSKDQNFKNLMFEDGGDLLGDFMKMVTLRID